MSRGDLEGTSFPDPTWAQPPGRSSTGPFEALSLPKGGPGRPLRPSQSWFSILTYGQGVIPTLRPSVSLVAQASGQDWEEYPGPSPSPAVSP